MRRQFVLADKDRRFLEANYPDWETIINDRHRVLLLHGFPIPDGYTIKSSTAAIVIPADYPTQGLDMVYFYPPIIRLDGKEISKTNSSRTFDGIIYQRWSRHYTITRWNPSEDSLATHVMAIKDWLVRAIES